MNPHAIFGVSVLMSFIAFGVVGRLYIVPRLGSVSRASAVVALTTPHMFRFVGLSFLVPGVVASPLPGPFAQPAAYGDLGAAILAVVAVFALSARMPWAVVLVWIFNLWGAADLLHAFYQRPIRRRR